MDRYKDRFNRGLRESLSLKKCFCLYWELPNNPKTLFGSEVEQFFEDKTVLCVTREAHSLLIV